MIYAMSSVNEIPTFQYTIANGMNNSISVTCMEQFSMSFETDSLVDGLFVLAGDDAGFISLISLSKKKILCRNEVHKEAGLLCILSLKLADNTVEAICLGREGRLSAWSIEFAGNSVNRHSTCLKHISNYQIYRPSIGFSGISKLLTLNQGNHQFICVPEEDGLALMTYSPRVKTRFGKVIARWKFPETTGMIMDIKKGPILESGNLVSIYCSFESGMIYQLGFDAAADVGSIKVISSSVFRHNQPIMDFDAVFGPDIGNDVILAAVSADHRLMITCNKQELVEVSAPYSRHVAASNLNFAGKNLTLIASGCERGKVKIYLCDIESGAVPIKIAIIKLIVDSAVKCLTWTEKNDILVANDKGTIYLYSYNSLKKFIQIDRLSKA